MNHLIHPHRITLSPIALAQTDAAADWQSFVNQQLVQPVELAAMERDHEAIDLVSLYYLHLQLWRRAVALGNEAAVQMAESDVGASEMLLRKFASPARLLKRELSESGSLQPLGHVWS